MQENRHGEITKLIVAAQGGDETAKARLFDLVYDELRALAHRAMSSQRPGHSWQPTELVGQLYLRLDLSKFVMIKPSRALFYHAAAKGMRRLLIEHHRERMSQKRGGDRTRVVLDGVLDNFAHQHIDFVEFHDALDLLANTNGLRQADVAELRFFAGLSYNEIAMLLEMSASTVRDEIRKARSFLRAHMGTGA